MSLGRPHKKRVPGSGEKLLHALKLCGLSWDARRRTASHVLNFKRWRELGLPRSSNTIIEDIKNGIPRDRLVHYSKFFDVDPMIFANGDISPSSKEFEYEVLQSRRKISLDVSLPVLGIEKSFCNAYYEQNDFTKISKLYAILSGVHMLYLKELHSDIIYRSVINVYNNSGSHLFADGHLTYFNAAFSFKCLIYKWNTFLHVNYYSVDYSIIGYMIAQDPLCSPYISSSFPLSFKLYGISNSITSSAVPDIFLGLTEKYNIPLDMSQHAFYARVCEEVSE
ncbi:MAG: hypothetical protein GYA47_14055 [Desulfovibrio sp.]|nr:hypothetical protein [Desulfovibrio sp.]